MDHTSSISQEGGENLAGRLAYVQFTNNLSNFVEREILSEGWESSADTLGKIVSKKNLPKFNKALHGAILAGFNESLNEMFSQVELPKRWQLLDQEVNSNHDPDLKATLKSTKLEQKNALLSLIAEKKKKITEIKQQINVGKLILSTKIGELEDMKLVMNQKIDLLEEFDSIVL